MASSNIVVCIWDFDKTIIPGNMQEPLFDLFDINSNKFWEEVDNLSSYYLTKGIVAGGAHLYLNHILSYVNHGIFNGLNNQLLNEIGSKLKFCPGMPHFLRYLKDYVEERFGGMGILLEHYVISNGIKEIVKGSIINEYLDGLWGCEFIETPAPPFYKSISSNVNEQNSISQIGLIIDKIKAIFEINKGTNKNKSINVNSFMENSERRIPFDQMIYIGDGESDIPAFSVVKKFGGFTFGVYPPNNKIKKNLMKRFLMEERIMDYGTIDYSYGSETFKKIVYNIDKIAENIFKKNMMVGS